MHEFERGEKQNEKNRYADDAAPLYQQVVHLHIYWVHNKRLYNDKNNTFCCGDRMKSLPTLAVPAAVSAKQEVEFYGGHGWKHKAIAAALK